PPRGGTPSAKPGGSTRCLLGQPEHLFRSKCGRVLQPGTYPLNGTIAVCVYRLGLKTDFCHRGRSPRLVGCLAQLSELPVSDQEHQVRLILWLTAGSETTQAGVTRS